MAVCDVPRARWGATLERFTQAHCGWLASLVTVGPGADLVSHTDWYPLASVTVARTGRRATFVRVDFQRGPTVCVKAPQSLGIDRRSDGAERALEIKGADGVFVRVAFRATARLEEMDGIAPAELLRTA